MTIYNLEYAPIGFNMQKSSNVTHQQTKDKSWLFQYVKKKYLKKTSDHENIFLIN